MKSFQFLLLTAGVSALAIPWGKPVQHDTLQFSKVKAFKGTMAGGETVSASDLGVSRVASREDTNKLDREDSRTNEYFAAYNRDVSAFEYSPMRPERAAAPRFRARRAASTFEDDEETFRSFIGQSLHDPKTEWQVHPKQRATLRLKSVREYRGSPNSRHQPRRTADASTFAYTRTPDLTVNHVQPAADERSYYLGRDPNSYYAKEENALKRAFN